MTQVYLTDDVINACIEKSEIVTDLTCRFVTDKINLSDGSNKNTKLMKKHLEDAGIDLSSKSRLVNLSAGNSGADGSTGVGATTLDISNELIQDISPPGDLLDNSMFNLMLPFKTYNAVETQQDTYEANYGNAQAANGASGAFNVVPLLSSSGKTYSGYTYNARSVIRDNELIKWRELGSSTLTAPGLQQKMVLQQLLLAQQTMTSVELARIETLLKGSFLYDNITVGTGIPSSQIYTATESLGTYSRSTNTLSVNEAMTTNLLKEISAMLTAIKNMGVKIRCFLIPNTIYLALFNSPPIQDRTLYMTATNPHNIQAMRDDLFENTTIPALAGVPIIPDDRTFKFASGPTTTLNTRPIMYGETVDSASFRGMVIIEPSSSGGAVSKVGNMGFFPNVYNRPGMSPAGGEKRSMGYGGNIALITQDLSSPGNWLNQEIQIIATTCIGPVVALPNLIFPYDFNVTITA